MKYIQKTTDTSKLYIFKKGFTCLLDGLMQIFSFGHYIGNFGVTSTVKFLKKS